MPTQFSFFIIGQYGAGKSLFGELIASGVGVPRASTCYIVYEELARQRGVQRWELESCPKEEILGDLVRVGNALCDVDPSALVAPLLERGVRVIDGIRRPGELKAARQAARACGLWPIVVWVDRHTSVKDNTEVTAADADYVISNHADVAHLAKLAANFVGEFVTPATEQTTAHFFGEPAIDCDWQQESTDLPSPPHPPHNESEGGFDLLGDSQV